MNRRGIGNGQWYKPLLSAIDQFWKSNHYPPTIRELMAISGCTSTSIVTYYLKFYAKQGKIRMTEFGHPVPPWVDMMFEKESDEYIPQA